MSKDVHTPVTTHDDGTFIRTALVVRPGAEDEGSVAIVDPQGKRLALLNLFAYENGNLIVDVIDVDERFANRSALAFREGRRQALDAAKVVSVDFRGVKEGA
jgi:hypothetical protein